MGRMVTLIDAVMAYIVSLFLPRRRLALEVIALRQKVAVLKRKQPRPKLDRVDRLFWTVLRQLWIGWLSLSQSASDRHFEYYAVLTECVGLVGAQKGIPELDSIAGGMPSKMKTKYVRLMNLLVNRNRTEIEVPSTEGVRLAEELKWIAIKRIECCRVLPTLRRSQPLHLR